MTVSDSHADGCFITLEGLDGAGKSTHIDWLIGQIRARGIDVVSTREPGGTSLGEALRELLLHQPMSLQTETLLMFAARSEHLQQVIRPTLASGQWVVCDRFTDATYAYQGGGRQLGGVAVQQLEQWVHADLQPDLTWLFDVPLEVARQRLAQGRDLDRFEQEGQAFFQRTRDAYYERVKAYPDRIRIIDSTQSIESIREVLAAQLDNLVARWKSSSSTQ
jgi:dTMP kinase